MVYDNSLHGCNAIGLRQWGMSDSSCFPCTIVGVGTLRLFSHDGFVSGTRLALRHLLKYNTHTMPEIFIGMLGWHLSNISFHFSFWYFKWWLFELIVTNEMWCYWCMPVCFFYKFCVCVSAYEKCNLYMTFSFSMTDVEYVFARN